MVDEQLPKVESARQLRPLTEWFTEEGTFSHCTFAFVTPEYNVYVGQTSIRKYDLTAKIIKENLRPIPDEEIYPQAPLNLSIASPEDDQNVFIKGPALSLYHTFAGTDLLPKLLLQEAETLELISKGFHPNIVRYHGCLIKRGCLVGIVLGRLTQLLQYRFEECNRKAFDIDACMQKIESAVQFLHSLELAHNDLKPTNIMLDEDDDPYITDFGSCRPFGSLLITGGTPGWVDENFTHSASRNDKVALEKIRVWLIDKVTTC